MGTTWHITLVDMPASVDVHQVERSVQDALQKINGLMSTYDENSELSQFNRVEINRWFPVDDQTAFVVNLAGEISELTGGAFDVTVDPLIRLWGFGPGADLLSDKIPSSTAIEESLAQVDYRAVEIRLAPVALRKLAPVSLDLSAIAKGYAVDETAKLLESLGIENYLVEIGGEIRASGHNSRKGAWVIGVERPVMERATPQKAIQVSGKALATSGDYRNYFEKDGKRYSHTMDPRTGYPIKHKLASVTVIADLAATADALATALNVMGPEQGLSFAEDKQLAAYFIVREGDGFREFMTAEFEPYLQ